MTKRRCLWGPWTHRETKREATDLVFSIFAIDAAIRSVCKTIGERGGGPASDWTGCSEDELWRELVSCILGSRVRFESACRALEGMEEERLLSAARRGNGYDQYERDIRRVLSNGYPFYRVRSQQVRCAAERVYGCGRTIRELLEETTGVRHARRVLSYEIAGIGPKQASLFLRNIGYSEEVAIFDVHVLSYMRWAGITDTEMKSVSTIDEYEELEEYFIEHARLFGHPISDFDVAVWVVAKVVKEEAKRGSSNVGVGRAGFDSHESDGSGGRTRDLSAVR